MLAFPLFWVFNYSDYYSSIKDKYPTLYAISFCFFTTFQFTDTD